MTSPAHLAHLAHLARSGALLALLLLPTAVAAQASSPLPGRLERNLQPRARVEGLSAAEAREWNDVVARAAEILAATPEVQAPPAGVCLRLRTYVDEAVVGPRATSELGFSIAERYDARGCSRVTTSGVSIALNDAMRLLRPDGSLANEELADAEGPIVEIPMVGRTRGGRPVWVINGDRAVLLTRGTEPLLVPVTAERWLRWHIDQAERGLADVQAVHVEGADALERWQREDRPRLQAAQAEALAAMQGRASAEEIARVRASHARMLEQTEEGIRRMAAVLAGQDGIRVEGVAKAEQQLAGLRAQLAALSPAARRGQACRSDRPRELLGPCHDGNRVWSLNPRYFSSSLPKSAAQVLVVSTPHGRHPMEPRAHAELRWRVFDAVDHDALAALLR